MPYTIEYDPDKACMICSMTGLVDNEIIEKYASELSAAMEKHGCSRVLNDLRHADLELSTLNIYDIPVLVSKAGIGLLSKRAIVFNSKEKDVQFFETVSVNRGQLVKAFTDIDEALQWQTTSTV